MTESHFTPSITSVTSLHRGTFKVYLRPDGSIVVPDLAEPLIPFLQKTGADKSFWEAQPCAVEKPAIALCRQMVVDISRDALGGAAAEELWRLHGYGMSLLKARGSRPQLLDRRDAVSLLDLKCELANRMLVSCSLCERRCKVNRLRSETGFCGLEAGAQVAAHSMLYNEGPFVGAPTFSVFLRGCCLRCNFCYRPDELKAKGRAETSPSELAATLDHAADAGAQSWHFLGGNPDESLPAVFQALSLTQRSLPLVWNSALMLTPKALELLMGVVDVWLPDFKFGNDACANQAAQIDGYIGVVKRNLLALRSEDFVAVRHMTMAEHAQCCTEPITAFVLSELPNCRLHTFPAYRNTSKADCRRESYDHRLYSNP